MAGFSPFNPLTFQGQLNRISVHVIVTDFPQLTVTAPFMSKSLASITFEGPWVDQIGTATGLVNSPKPYVMASITVNLLRTQYVSGAWIAQMEDTAVIGDVTIYSDAPQTFPPIELTDCSITEFEPGAFDGTDPTVKATVKGVFVVNNQLWASA